LDILKQEDAEENNKRLEKVRENKRQEFTEKIHQTAQRLQQVQAEKDKAYFEKRKLQSQLESEKSTILKDFEKKKKLLLANKTHSDHMSVDTRGETPAANEVHSAQITSAKSVAKLAPLTTSNKMAGSSSVKNLRGGSVTRKSVDKPTKSPLGVDYQFHKNTAPGGSRQPSKALPNKTESSIKTTERKPETANAKSYHTPSQSRQGNNGGAAKSIVVKEDTLIHELQTKEYQQQSVDLRNNQLGELLKMIDSAVVRKSFLGIFN